MPQGRTRIDEISWDLEHRISREIELDDRIGMRVKHDGNSLQRPCSEVHRLELVEYEIFVLREICESVVKGEIKEQLTAGPSTLLL